MHQLRQVVLQSVQTALAQNNAHGFNENTLTEKIIVKLTPFVRRGVGQQVALLERQKNAQSGQIVTSVIRELKPIMVRIIKQSVRNYDGDLSQYGNLVEAILRQLRPVVLIQVQNALATSSYKGLNAEKLTDEIIIRLRPFIEEGVQREIEELEPTVSADDIVSSVIQELKPIMVRIIKQAVQNYEGDLSQYGNLVEAILRQLEPVVLVQVQNALATSSHLGLSAENLTDEIIIRLRPFVEEGVQREIEELEPTVSANDIVNQVIVELEPIVIQVIHTTVQSSNVDLDNEEGLVTTIVTQLQPVVFSEVTTAIDANNANYDAQELTNKIIIRLVSM